ncbi:hypothetical protein N0V84_003076 [Fusarium piperis]|uniref:Heterokaryon incompatibility domain-containing protein n=1 Tax=Fusarium piperis TaxID=1435070 RepID=A0A9W9BSU1_9HYPO|nr:hypothetical protein N0V84_003076 [Fusarium piperis]
MADADLRNQLADLRSKFISDVICDTWVAWRDGVIFSAELRLICLRLFFDYVGGNAYIHVLIILILWPFGTRGDDVGLIKASYPFYLWLCGYGGSAKGVFYLARFGLPALVNVATVVLVCQLYHMPLLDGFRGVFGAIVRVVILLALEELAEKSHLRFQEVTFKAMRFYSDWRDSNWLWLQVTHVSPLLSTVFDLMELVIFSNYTVLFEYQLYQRREKRSKALTEPMSRPEGMPDYSYENLGQGEIRLVQIYIDPTVRKPKYKLIKTTMEKAPRYHAISYVWGSGDRTHALVIDDAWLQTTATTFEILHDHALFWCSGQEDFIWIDFLCINQNDLAERSQQVKLMGAIYSQADEVIAFLQPEDYDEVDTASAFFTNLREDVVRKHRRLYGPPVFRFGGFRTSFISYWVYFFAARNDSVASPGWNALSKLFGHVYWTRMWVIQEVILSKQFRVFYGERPVEWESLYRFAMNPEQDLAHIDLEFNDYVRGEAVEKSRIKAAGTLGRRISFRNGEPVRFVDMLTSSRPMQATDPRDRIFALYGLLGDSQVPGALLPDYEISMRTLYTRVARHFVTHGDCEWILCMASPGYSQRNYQVGTRCPNCRNESFTCDYHGSPSWIPDWTSPYPRLLPHALPRPKDSQEENMEVSMAGNSLIVPSWTIGHIETLLELHFAPTMHTAADAGPAVKRVYNTLYSISELLSALDPKYPTGEAKVDALARTIMPTSRDRILDPFRRTWEVCQSRRKTLDWMRHGMEIEGYVDSTLKHMALQELSNELTAAKADKWVMETGHAEMRSISVTDYGFFALVPRYSKVGDVVCVLKGAKSSFVMRPVEKGVVELVGDCHVHEASRFKKGDPERIEIR